MAGFKVEVKSKFEMNVPFVKGMARKAFAAWLRGFLKECVRGIRRELATPYPPASKPGEAPRLRTGELRGSVSYVVRESEMAGAVTVDAPHAGYLVRGTRRMRPRPFGLKTIQRLAGALRGMVTISRRMGE